MSNIEKFFGEEEKNLDPQQGQTLKDFSSVVDAILAHTKGNIVLGIPLGAGKPIQLVNKLYEKASSDRDLQLTIVTALTLAPSTPSSRLEEKFFDQLDNSIFGGPPPSYALDCQRGKLPKNVKVIEFYSAPGSLLYNIDGQRNHLSSNYSEVAENIKEIGMNVVAQTVAPLAGHPQMVSLGTNPDIIKDFFYACDSERRSVPMGVGVINPNMPPMRGGAVVPKTFFNVLVNDAPGQLIQSVPNQPLSDRDYAIGLFASTLVKDGGTLQIGIGNLSDALAQALILRHQDNQTYLELLKKINHGVLPSCHMGGLSPFTEGLYGCSEMFSEGFLALRKAGILKRRVKYNKQSAFLHAAFILGSQHFYKQLLSLSESELDGIGMEPVSFTNKLGEAERNHRKDARFFNLAMAVGLLGDVHADSLEDGRTVSGVGGHFDFVQMAHQLEEGRAITLLPSTRKRKNKIQTNIGVVRSFASSPRQMRDIVVSEYGIADLKGKTDGQVIESLLSIADARAQDEIIASAHRAKKIPKDFVVPARWKENLPAMYDSALRSVDGNATLPTCPFGSDFSETEIQLIKAMKNLKQLRGSTFALLRAGLRGKKSLSNANKFEKELKRVGLQHPKGMRERVYRLLVLSELDRVT